MQSLPILPGPGIQSGRHWKAVPAQDAAALIQTGTTLAVSWLSDGMGQALRAGFMRRMTPRDLTVIYAATTGDGRTHGLNLLAQEGMVRRVIGGQWHPVPGLQALAQAERIEAYSLPVGMILRLFRDIAEGLPAHISRFGVGTNADPRHGGGRLNRRTRDQLVHLVHPAGEDALLMRALPLDVGLLGVAFMRGTGEIAMTREAMTIARAVRRSGGLVIGQSSRIGTLDRLPPGQIVVPDSLIDLLVTEEPEARGLETFASRSERPWPSL
jgi:propionate CoA-transferase